MTRFSASNAGRLMACSASADLGASIPNWVPPVIDRTKDNAANRGTRVHTIFEQVWGYSASDIRAMARVLQYVGDLRATRRFNVLIEHEIEATWLGAATPPKTTADLVLYTKDELHILDTKWGKIPVEVTGNTQLLYYAATYGHLAPKAKGATLHILQPHADNLEAWFADTTVIGKFMDAARVANKEIESGNYTFGPSDYCTFCPANPHSRSDKGRPLCPAMMKMLYPQPFDEDAILGLD